MHLLTKHGFIQFTDKTRLLAVTTCCYKMRLLGCELMCYLFCEKFQNSPQKGKWTRLLCALVIGNLCASNHLDARYAYTTSTSYSRYTLQCIQKFSFLSEDQNPHLTRCSFGHHEFIPQFPS